MYSRNSATNSKYVWIAASISRFACSVFFSGSCVLFIGPVSTIFLLEK